jgi:hypothetical protein
MKVSVRIGKSAKSSPTLGTGSPAGADVAAVGVQCSIRLADGTGDAAKLQNTIRVEARVPGLQHRPFFWAMEVN